MDHGKEVVGAPNGRVRWWTMLLIGLGLSGAYFLASNFKARHSFLADRQVAQSIEIGSGALKLMWATPIFTVNLHNNSRILRSGFDATALNRGLRAAVLTEFDRFVHEMAQEQTSRSGSSSRAYNELFFAWQRETWEETGASVLEKYPEFVQMTAVMKSAAATFLDMVGQRLPDEVEMFSWATLHRDCMFHLPHTHPYNLVSGVYYARVPPGAGDIVFDDPRGPLPPFENRIIHTPKEGDLIIFPSWLLHQVSPTFGDEERISFSFNIPGDWTQTADVSLTVPLR